MGERNRQLGLFVMLIKDQISFQFMPVPASRTRVFPNRSSVILSAVHSENKGLAWLSFATGLGRMDRLRVATRFGGCGGNGQSCKQNPAKWKLDLHMQCNELMDSILTSGGWY